MVALTLTILGAVGSIVGLLAYVDTRRSKRIKLLAYEHTAPFPLATARQHASDYELSIHYRSADGEEEEVIEAAFVTYLRFANFGSEPIRAQDIATSNPLRVEVEDVRVLDIALAGAHREVNQIELDAHELGSEMSKASIKFDFLDRRDGGLIRVLSTDRDATIRLVGDIIGMPEGITRSDQPIAKGPWGKIGVALWAVVQVATFGVVAYVYREVQGSWSNVWLLTLPFAAVVLPVVAAAIVSETIWPSRVRTRPYPKELRPPSWLRPHLLNSPVSDPMLVDYPAFAYLDDGDQDNEQPPNP